MKPVPFEKLKELASSLSVVTAPVGDANVLPFDPREPRHQSPLGEQISAADLDKLRDALSHISSDVPRGNGSFFGPDGQPVSDYWLGVMLAIHREHGSAGKEPAREWSQQSPRYTDEGFEKAWAAFDPHHRKPVTIRSVYKLAKANGWRGEIPPDAPNELPNATGSRYHLMDRAAIMATPPTEWLVKVLLPKTGLTAIYGPSGSGKSFIAIDLAMAIARAEPWFGFRSTACPVTYVMQEGEAGLRNRIGAWERYNKTTIPPEFTAITQPVDLTKEQDIADLSDVVPMGGVIIIDTLNRAAPGLDENSSQDMGRVITAMKRLQAATGGLVLFVHHTGKDVSKGLRGHSSLYAALDGAIEVSRTANSRSWSVAKAKDGADGEDRAFKLEVVELGRDADGDAVTSCVVTPDASAVFRRREPTGARQKAAMKALIEALRDSHHLGQAGSAPDTTCIRVEDAIAIVASTLTTEVPNKRGNRAKGIVQRLVDGRYLQSGLDPQEEAWVWL